MIALIGPIEYHVAIRLAASHVLMQDSSVLQEIWFQVFSLQRCSRCHSLHRQQASRRNNQQCQMIIHLFSLLVSLQMESISIAIRPTHRRRLASIRSAVSNCFVLSCVVSTTPFRRWFKRVLLTTENASIRFMFVRRPQAR